MMMKTKRRFLMKPGRMAAILALCAILLNVTGDFTAEAKKKAAGPDPAAQAEAELKKTLEPINTELIKLMVKIQSRALLSPGEAGQIAELKYQLLDIINKNPQNALISTPLYQAGVLFSIREEYNDAYEMFNYLAGHFPETSYGTKAKGQIQQLEKRFGAGYFAIEAALSPAAQPTATASATPAATPASAPASSAPAVK
jgi:hypothetical protein